MYAIFRAGGKQYKVAENDVVKLEKIENVKEGDVIQLDQILALGTEKGITLGDPLVKGTTVSAQVLEQGKDDKVLIFKKKRRHNYRRKMGHRQSITVVRILDVSGKGEKKVIEKKAKVTKETAEKPVEKKEKSVTSADKKVTETKKTTAKEKAKPAEAVKKTEKPKAKKATPKAASSKTNKSDEGKK